MLVATLSANAQTSELIKAKWVYEDFADKEGMDSLSLGMMGKMFAGMSFYFRADGVCVR